MNIKDYLHLYLGCEVKDDYDNDYKQLEAVFYDNNQCYLKGRGRVTLHTRNLNEVQPVLRPLSDMTEEEAKQIISIRGLDGVYREDSIVVSAIDSLTGHKWPNTFGAASEATKFLLSKHFDLFNLHEAGLCLYKNEKGELY